MHLSLPFTHSPLTPEAESNALVPMNPTSMLSLMIHSQQIHMFEPAPFQSHLILGAACEDLIKNSTDDKI